MPLILAIETSTPCGGVALSEEGRIIGEVSFERRQGHAESLHSLIKLVLEVSGTELPQLSAVAVDLGPGAFTALRVGLAAAKGLVFALKKPLLGASSLEILAGNAAASGGLICPVIDARHGQICGAVYRWEKGQPQMVRQPLTASPAVLGAMLKKLSKPLIVLGGGARLYQKELTRAAGKQAVFADPLLDRPQLAVLAALAERRLASGQSCDLITCAPYYLREGAMEFPPRSMTGSSKTAR